MKIEKNADVWIVSTSDERKALAYCLFNLAGKSTSSSARTSM